MLVTNLPNQYNYTTWDEVFQSENGQQVGWARETVSLTGTAGVYQIGTLVILSADNKTITVPANQAALAAAAGVLETGASRARSPIAVDGHPSTSACRSRNRLSCPLSQ